MKAEIRAYLDQDETALIHLWSHVLPDSAPHNDATTSLRQKLAHDRGSLLVATVEGKVVGAVMGGYDGHRGWIYSLAVSEEFRRHGVGTALIRRMESLLGERGCLKLNLQVRSSNAPVVEFYRKLGYRLEERISMGKCLY